MSQFVTDDLLEKVRSANFAKHAVMRSIIKEHNENIDESSLNTLLMKIYHLFYDSSMVSSLFAEIQEREEQKSALQQMDLEDLALKALSEDMADRAAISDSELSSLIVIDDATMESMMPIAESISEEEAYLASKEMKVSLVIDFFSALQGSSSSLLGALSDLTEVDEKYVLDLFSLFVEKQIDDLSATDQHLRKSLGSSALNIELTDQTFTVFIYTPKKWIDQGQTQRLSLGLMIEERRARYVPLMSQQIVEQLEKTANTILGTVREDLSNIQFRLMDLSIRKTLSGQVKKLSDFIARFSLALQQMQIGD